jgi:hypothetical protein
VIPADSGASTVTVAGAVELPPAPVAVRVYVVVVLGPVIVLEPDVATAPIPLSIVTVVAFVVDQVRVVESPGLMVDGLMLNCIVGLGEDAGVTKMSSNHAVWPASASTRSHTSAVAAPRGAVEVELTVVKEPTEHPHGAKASAMN